MGGAHGREAEEGVGVMQTLEAPLPGEWKRGGYSLIDHGHYQLCLQLSVGLPMCLWYRYREVTGWTPSMQSQSLTLDLTTSILHLWLAPMNPVGHSLRPQLLSVSPCLSPTWS